MPEPLSARALGAGSFAPASAVSSRQVADAAAALGSTLKQAGALEVEAQRLYGDSKAYRAVAGNAFGQRVISSGRAVAGVVTPATDLAGSLTNLAKAQEQAAKDFLALSAVLADPHSTVGQKVMATTKATQSAAMFVQRQNAFVGSLDAADKTYLMRNGLYAKVTQSSRPAVQLLGKVNATVMTPILKVATVSGAAAGIGLGLIALPNLLKGTADAGRKLADIIEDPAASEDAKLAAIADTARGGAGVVMALNGVKGGVQSLVAVAKESATLAPAVASVASNPVMSGAGKVLGRLFKILLPIADAGMLIADSVRLKQTLANPEATGMAKAKAVLAVGLGVVKIATYLMPQTLILRSAYLVASLGQLGLAMVDLSHTLIPSLQRAGAAAVAAIKDPGTALRNTGAAIGNGFAKLGSWVKSGFGLAGKAAAQPGMAAQSSRSWFADLAESTRHSIESAWYVAQASSRFLARKVKETLGVAPEVSKLDFRAPAVSAGGPVLASPMHQGVPAAAPRVMLAPIGPVPYN
ncbi:MAG: hypothetical protein FJZ00_04835 [Candidatus Sericytochromatia bacterium]|uniref:Uncharacterized protein n=1 Tax=Candidatus Tanganyikabacteria bacterium TaxID=2961651 RepID=A0A937X382_9BACT|nr:hypothetical protein [Candidatus Tanganyikabacteria bacterium]